MGNCSLENYKLFDVLFTTVLIFAPFTIVIFSMVYFLQANVIYLMGQVAVIYLMGQVAFSIFANIVFNENDIVQLNIQFQRHSNISTNMLFYSNFFSKHVEVIQTYAHTSHLKNNKLGYLLAINWSFWRHNYLSKHVFWRLPATVAALGWSRNRKWSVTTADSEQRCFC